MKTNKHPDSEVNTKLSSLSKWIDKQQTLYQKRKNGEKNGLSKSRVKRLEAIGFEFETFPGKSVNFCNWDAKLDILKEFKKKWTLPCAFSKEKGQK